MDTVSCIQQIKNNGYVNAGNRFLSAEDVEKLSALSKKCYSSLDSGHKDHLTAEAGAGGVRGIIEHDPEIAKIANKILSHPDIKEMLTSVLGTDYKIWQINFRRSLPHDKGLSLHQDAKGQVNLCILLDDNLEGDGATAFFPESHLIRQRVKELNTSLAPKLFRPLSFMVKPFAGKMGDVGLFFNRTWHGRFPNSSDKNHDIFMIGFFPAHTQYGLNEPYKNWSHAFLDSIKGTELCRLLDPEVGTQKVSEGVYRVVGKSEEIPFSMKLESFSNDHHLSSRRKLRLELAFLTTAMNTGRPFKQLLRKITGNIA